VKRTVQTVVPAAIKSGRNSSGIWRSSCQTYPGFFWRNSIPIKFRFRLARTIPSCAAAPPPLCTAPPMAAKTTGWAFSAARAAPDLQRSRARRRRPRTLRMSRRPCRPGGGTRRSVTAAASGLAFFYRRKKRKKKRNDGTERRGAEGRRDFSVRVNGPQLGERQRVLFRPFGWSSEKCVCEGNTVF
jgi:hypothetical protein